MSSRFKTALAFVAVVSASAITVSTSPASALPTFQPMKNVNSSLCLAIPNSSTADGVAAVQWDCNGNADQQWQKYYYYANEEFSIVSGNNIHECLAIEGSIGTQGANAVQEPCDDTYSQRWEVDSANRIWNESSQMCLAVRNASTTHGVNVIQWKCEDPATHPEQRWTWNS